MKTCTNQEMNSSGSLRAGFKSRGCEFDFYESHSVSKFNCQNRKINLSGVVIWEGRPRWLGVVWCGCLQLLFISDTVPGSNPACGYETGAHHTVVLRGLVLGFDCRAKTELTHHSLNELLIYGNIYMYRMYEYIYICIFTYIYTHMFVCTHYIVLHSFCRQLFWQQVQQIRPSGDASTTGIDGFIMTHGAWTQVKSSLFVLHNSTRGHSACFT